MTFCPSCEKQGCTIKYDELKLINHVQTSEILLIGNFTKYSLVKGIYIYRQNLALNNLQRLIRHNPHPKKKQPTNSEAFFSALQIGLTSFFIVIIVWYLKFITKYFKYNYVINNRKLFKWAILLLFLTFSNNERDELKDVDL